MTPSKIVPAFLMVAALVAAASSLSLGIWSFGAPGPGLFPLAASVIMIVGLLRKVIKTSHTHESDDATDWVRFLQYCVAIVGFVVGVHLLGTGPAIFLFIVLVLGRIEQVGWMRSTAIAAIAAATSWSVFHNLLSVPLPQGIWS
ncbi:tripartite tricarboxylate transporter TctB family protein [Aliirhizobium smilacinae]|uniref:Tripartite tricarboxylate transporter TctB family protein n=1 Tax=Aliirhizobium smilacinae TaxID=1395944 RepID=A0A5C4XD71_9HYPH|nr:tripartite tricarboxylate transporter TctB family protein [Rhizobium smilacinae]TNM60334.1 tripartite tricarboxylate transporter TctB family protein [Rhizobium smilacinae]